MTNLKFTFPGTENQDSFEIIAPIIGAIKEEGCKTFSLQIEGFKTYLFEVVGGEKIIEVNFYLYDGGENLLEISLQERCLNFENIDWRKASFDEWL